ncbi:phosphatase PAP2 family protein [Candidatus Micrarchaeota archaeon]|nr:phosphatase PAP2 family protein [Candidatus Micrarchaeota archaeon]
MDAITNAVLSVDNPLVHEIGMILQEPVIYAVIVLALIVIGERRGKKQGKILVSIIVAALLILAAKHFMAVERPCADDGWCPEGYSFPSMHATVAFALMTGFLNKKSYGFYLLFALLVAFTRLNIGVHTFYDVAAALPVAMLSYYIAAEIFRRLDDG